MSFWQGVPMENWIQGILTMQNSVISWDTKYSEYNVHVVHRSNRTLQKLPRYHCSEDDKDEHRAAGKLYLSLQHALKSSHLKYQLVTWLFWSPSKSRSINVSSCYPPSEENLSGCRQVIIHPLPTQIHNLRPTSRDDSIHKLNIEYNLQSHFLWELKSLWLIINA